MVSYQRPISSGHSSQTGATDVLAGIDLSGRVAIVTGGYSGIGLATTRALAAAGAHVVVPARRPTVAVQELADVKNVRVAELDLAHLRGVQKFAESFLDDHDRLDLLVNNAAVMATPLTRVGPGWELQFAVNHLGHYALTNHLWPALRDTPGARVVSVTSRGHKASDIQWDDVQLHNNYEKWRAYGQSKTANVLFARHLDRLAEPHDVRVFAAYPGGIRTPLQRHLTDDEMAARGWIADDFPWKTPDQGAATTVWAATSPQLDGMGGVYLEDCEVAHIADLGTPEGVARGVNPYAIDPSAADRLWTLTAGLTNVDAFA